MNLGKNIYKYRTQKNLSQGDLADALDVSRQSVSKWENNNAVPDLERLVKMAALFEITLDELVTGKKPEPEVIPLPAPAAPVQKLFSVRMVLGILLFLMAGLIVVLSFFFAHSLGIYTTEGILLALQLGIAGVMCLMPKSWDAYSVCWYGSILMLPFSAFYDYATRRLFSLFVPNILLLILCRFWRKSLDNEK